jgi:hypothetical protein
MLRVHRAVCAEDNATMHAEDLEREWRRCGLRQADLEAALREMAQRRLLVMRQEGAQKNYELTESGVREFRNSRDAVTFQVANWITLVRARARQLLPQWKSRHQPSPERRLASR